jgi:hypothetical protein
MSETTAIRWAHVLGIGLCLGAMSPNVADAKCGETQMMSDQDAAQYLDVYGTAVGKLNGAIEQQMVACESGKVVHKVEALVEGMQAIEALRKIPETQCAVVPGKFWMQALVIVSGTAEMKAKLAHLQAAQCK